MNRHVTTKPRRQGETSVVYVKAGCPRIVVMPMGIIAIAVRSLLLFLFIGLFSHVYALAEKDLGIYLVVRDDGQVTSEAFRLFKDGESWKIQGRQADGVWQDVLCDKERCALQTTTKEQIQTMFDENTLSQITPDCVNSRSFAFCRYALVKDPTFVGYLFVATDRTPAVIIRVVRAAGQ